MRDEEKFAVVIVTFYPGQHVLAHIASMCLLCPCVIVVDNTPGDIVVPFPASPNLLTKRLGTNKGLAYALNQGMALAHHRKIEQTFLLDQDSRLPVDYFTRMLAFKAEMDARYRQCAFYVPSFWDRNSKSFANFPVITRFGFRHTGCAHFTYDMGKGALIAITSGMLITWSRYRDIGSFPDDYFIDFIDNAYCLKAGAKGLFVAVNCRVTLDHAIGNRRTHRFGGFSVKPNHHAAVRRYYIARNGLQTAMRFRRHYPSYIILIGLRLSHEFFSILIYEKDKRRKTGALIYGCWHGLMGRMGKCLKYPDD